MSRKRVTPSAALGAPSKAVTEGVSDGLAGRFQRGLGEFFHAPGEVVVQRPVGHAALRQELRPTGGGVSLITQ